MSVGSIKPAKRLTPGEYLAQERAAEFKSEYHGGVIVAMAGGTMAHSLIASNLLAGLHAALKSRKCQVYNSDMRVYLPPTLTIHREEEEQPPAKPAKPQPQFGGLMIYPDVTVVCGEPQLLDAHQDTLTNPLALFEVLSPSTELFDRVRKFQHARETPSLQNFVLISQDQMLVEQYVRQPSGDWLLRTANAGDLRVEKLDVTLALAEIYSGVTFPPPEASITEIR